MRKFAPALALLALAASDRVVVQYDCIPNYANWGGVTALYKKLSGVVVPPDMKGSSIAMAAIEKERAHPVADVAYYSGAIGYEAARRGLHAPYKPRGWEKIPPPLKDPNGLWFTVHTGAIAFVVNTKALGNRPIPRSWADLLKPAYKDLIAYDDPTWGGTSYTFVYGITRLLGFDYLKKLDANVINYPRESVYNAVLRGEYAIWINADGNGYKMKYEDHGPIEVVIPREGSFSMPLVMGLVNGAPHEAEAKRYLDWLLTPAAQGEMARGYFRPVVAGTMPREIATRFLPPSEYKRVRDLPLADSAAAADALKKRWTAEVRGAR